MLRRRGKQQGRTFYIRSPGRLHPLHTTQPGGTGIVELAEDGLRFSGETSHLWTWDDLRGWRLPEPLAAYELRGWRMPPTSIEIKATLDGGGGYSIEVWPEDGLRRWLYLLPEHGLAEIPA